MTAKELIEKLQMLDPDKVIYMEYCDHHSFNFTKNFGLTEHGVMTNDAEDAWL